MPSFFISMHHIKPRRNGGSYTTRNLVLLHNCCHELVEREGAEVWASAFHHHKKMTHGWGPFIPDLQLR